MILLQDIVNWNIKFVQDSVYWYMILLVNIGDWYISYCYCGLVHGIASGMNAIATQCIRDSINWVWAVYAL